MEPTGKNRILIVDDHPIVRQGIAQLVNREADMHICCEAGDADQALEKANHCRHDIAIVDISLAGVSGIELIQMLRQHGHEIPILVMSMHDEALYAERALRAGARGYIMKQEASGKILAALRQILHGDIYVSDKLRSHILQRLIENRPETGVSSLAGLSNRELDILRMIGKGFSTGEIAHKFKRSVKTVEAHRANLKDKLKLKTGAELVRFAVQWTENEE